MLKLEPVMPMNVEKLVKRFYVTAGTNKLIELGRLLDEKKLTAEDITLILECLSKV